MWAPKNTIITGQALYKHITKFFHWHLLSDDFEGRHFDSLAWFNLIFHCFLKRSVNKPYLKLLWDYQKIQIKIFTITLLKCTFLIGIMLWNRLNWSIEGLLKTFINQGQSILMIWCKSYNDHDDPHVLTTWKLGSITQSEICANFQNHQLSSIHSDRQIVRPKAFALQVQRIRLISAFASTWLHLLQQGTYILIWFCTIVILTQV